MKLSDLLLFSADGAIFVMLYCGENTIFFLRDDNVLYILNQQAKFDFYSASLLKQQSVARHFAPLRHNVLILNQSVFALVTLWCMLIGETAYTNIISLWFDTTRDWTHGLSTTVEHANQNTDTVYCLPYELSKLLLLFYM